MRQTFILFVIMLAFAGCMPQNSSTLPFKRDYRRIISFAPSITETLFYLGLGSRVVGVTRYCNYPPQARDVPKIGDYLNPNFEMILKLRPDLVLLLKQHSSLSEFLSKNRIASRVIDNESVDAILQSFAIIGEMCGKSRQADSLIASIKKEISDVSAPPVRPKILFCIGRDNPGSGRISKVYIAGPKSFYSQLMQDAGGKNAYDDSAFAYPTFSAEGILKLAPDIIIDVMASVSKVQPEQAKNDWNELAIVPAAANGMVFCPQGDFMSIPGPRIGLILREMKTAVHEFEKKRGD